MKLLFKTYFNRAFIVFFCCSASNLLAAETYIWSVVPQFTGTVVHRDWTPLLRAIEKDTGYRFKLKLYKTIPGFENGFINGEPDIAYMNPYHAIMAKKAQGYRPIIRDGDRKLTGIIVTRKNSKLKTVQDLQNMKISFPSPNAFAASLYIRALLTEKEKIQFTPVYAKTHSNSYRYVLRNKVAASGAVIRTLKRERPEIQQQFQIIYKTPGSPSHPITVHKRVPNKVAIAVQKSIIKLTESKQGQLMLNAILIPKPVAANYKRDYQSLQDLKLDKYIVRSY